MSYMAIFNIKDTYINVVNGTINYNHDDDDDDDNDIGAIVVVT